jgi:tRNA threonylcarbamoyladenosine biosynthesis protein TsaB
MRLLALDTSTEACSVALLEDGRSIGRSAELARGHAEEILRMVNGVLKEAGASLGMLDGIAAGVGPGSFTGVRISVSVAQGLAFGAGLPVVPVSTLEALALREIGHGAERVLACLDARMGEVYFEAFAADRERALVSLGTPAVGPPSTVSLTAWPFDPGESADRTGLTDRNPSVGARGFAGVGRGFAAYPELLRLSGLKLRTGADRALPDAREMAALGALRLRAGGGLDPADLDPLYVRNKVALTEAERRAERGVAK